MSILNKERLTHVCLCTGKKDEQIELLELDKSGIRVASYWIEMMPKKLLQKKLNEAIIHAREDLERRKNVRISQ